MKKICCKCDRELPLTSFHKRCDSSDGLHNICKDCRLKKAKEYYAVAGSSIKDRRRLKYKENPQLFLTAAKKWKKENPESFKASLTKYRKNNRKKENARKSIMKKVYRGSIERQPCAVCGTFKVEAHHCDYSKPLDVMWLCKLHHAAWHRVFKVEG